MTGYREIDESDTSVMRPLGRRVARGTLTTTRSFPSSTFTDSSYDSLRLGDSGLRLEPEPEPEPELDATLVKQRDSLADAVARIEAESREFQELALSLILSGSVPSDKAVGTPALPRGRGGSTPRLARIARQHARQDGQRAPSLSDPLADVRFDVGDQVWVYSNTENKWIAGEVESIHAGESSKHNTHTRRTIVRVMYWAANAKRGKDIEANDRGLLRPFDGPCPRPPGE